MRRQSFNDNWQFIKQDGTIKPLCLPHDAMQEEKRSPKSPGGGACAFYPGGVYVYEKKFTAPPEWEQKHIVFQFEGIYRNSEVLINEKKAGGAAYGYIPFFVCADGLLHYGGENTIRVTADNKEQPNSRWYSGGGIYRPVWLWIGEKTHIEPEGVKVTTVSYSPAKVRVQVSHTGGADAQAHQIQIKISDGENVVAKAQGADAELEVPSAKLWNAETPNLYTCHVTLLKGDRVVDEARETFGIRKVEWSNRGLFINGKETLLRGGCVHHDNGILGAADYMESEMRRVRKLKEAGFNAIRSAHNPAGEALLAACDRYGVYVMDETWDMWYHHKNKFDYAGQFENYYRQDMKAMVDRDYNHPSVIMYSIGNEVSEPAGTKGVELAGKMTAYLHELDGSRAVTGGMNLMIISRSAKGNDIYKEDGGRDDDKQQKMNGMNSTVFNMITSLVGTGMNKGANGKKADAVTTPILDMLDIAGYNYASGRYPLEEKAHPKRIIVGSETFPQDIVKNWNMVKKYPYLIGDFMWTSWDYLGETGIGAWAYTPDGKGFEKPYPWLLADVGALDILGNPNGELFLAQAAWGLLQSPAIAVQPANHPGVKPAKAVWRGTNALPMWSYRNCEGNKTVVEVYTDAAMVELSLNGKLLGKKKVKKCKAQFKVTYDSGILQAAAYDAQGRKTGESRLVSATGKPAIRIAPETLKADKGEIVYVDVNIVGENGVVEANADTRLTVNVTGGELLAFGSANPRTEERYTEGSFTTYYGCAQAVVRANESGTMTVAVEGENLPKAKAEIIIN